MSIWQVLLIWLTVVTGTGCIGFLMAGIMTLNLEVDELAARNRPPQPPVAKPRKVKLWIWPVQIAWFASVILTDLLPPRAHRIYNMVVIVTVGIVFGCLIGFLVIRAFTHGWRAQRDGQFLIKVGLVCAFFAATAGCALWRFH